MKDPRKVVVALSGGVDSAVSALLLLRDGYEVHAIFMENWDPEVNGDGIKGRLGEGCNSREDYELVRQICGILGITLRKYNFVPEYWDKVFEPYLGALRKNLNPNPDIDCNSRIKFGVLLDRVIEDFGPDVKLATGHWARVICEDGVYHLGLCNNKRKDQTYFLSRLTQPQLSRVLFPLCDISSKDEVRSMARENGLPVWDRGDSMGICFIGDRGYVEFMGNFIPENGGDIVDIDDGRVLGRHRGLHLYVLQQRRGFQLGGQDERYFVCSKDVDRNVLYVCRQSRVSHYLYRDRSVCIDPHWISDVPLVNEDLYVRARHGGNFIRVRLLSLTTGECILSHDSQYLTSPGQHLVFYDINLLKCLGGAIYKGW